MPGLIIDKVGSGSNQVNQKINELSGKVVNLENKPDPVIPEVYQDNIPFIFPVLHSDVASQDERGIAAYLSSLNPPLPVSEVQNLYVKYISKEDTRPFIMEVTMTAGETMSIPLANYAGSDFSIDWGDGTAVENYYTNTASNCSHVYANAGTYQIQMRGKVASLNFSAAHANRNNVKKVVQWGDVQFIKSLRFYGCYYLTEIPQGEIPNFYRLTTAYNMFRSTGITSIPENLFALGFNIESFSSAFESTNISTSVPEGLFFNSPIATQFGSTFRDSPITGSIPERLFVNQPGATLMNMTFDGTRIESIPANLFAKNPEITTFQAVFAHNGYLQAIPSGLFDNNSKVEDFQMAFYNCYGIPEIPAGLFDHNPVVTDFSSTFQGLWRVNYIPSGLFDNNPLATDFSGTFYRVRMESIPADLFFNNQEVTTFDTCFRDTYIKSIPGNLFEHCQKVESFYRTFLNCAYLEGPAPELWLRPGVTGAECFRYSPLIENYAEIPANWK